MVGTGLMFEKETEDLTRTILDFFERTRFAYLSARENREEYEKEWQEVIDKIRDDFDSLNKLSEELKNYLEEKVLFEKTQPLKRQRRYTKQSRICVSNQIR